MLPFELIPATVAHAEAIARIWREAWPQSAGSADAETRTAFLAGQPAEYWASELARWPGCFTLAVSGGEPVGFSLLRAEGEGVELDRLFVLPSAQGSGVGRALLTDALARAQGEGAPWVSIWVVRGNPALALYLRRGFTFTGEGKNLATLTWDELRLALQ